MVQQDYVEVEKLRDNDSVFGRIDTFETLCYYRMLTSCKRRNCNISKGTPKSIAHHLESLVIDIRSFEPWNTPYPLLSRSVIVDSEVRREKVAKVVEVDHKSGGVVVYASLAAKTKLKLTHLSVPDVYPCQKCSKASQAQLATVTSSALQLKKLLDLPISRPSGQDHKLPTGSLTLRRIYP